MARVDVLKATTAFAGITGVALGGALLAPAPQHIEARLAPYVSTRTVNHLGGACIGSDFSKPPEPYTRWRSEALPANSSLWNETAKANPNTAGVVLQDLVGQSETANKVNDQTARTMPAKLRVLVPVAAEQSHGALYSCNSTEADLNVVAVQLTNQVVDVAQHTVSNFDGAVAVEAMSGMVKEGDKEYDFSGVFPTYDGKPDLSRPVVLNYEEIDTTATGSRVARAVEILPETDRCTDYETPAAQNGHELRVTEGTDSQDICGSNLNMPLTQALAEQQLNDQLDLWRVIPH